MMTDDDDDDGGGDSWCEGVVCASLMLVASALELDPGIVAARRTRSKRVQDKTLPMSSSKKWLDMTSVVETSSGKQRPLDMARLQVLP